MTESGGLAVLIAQAKTIGSILMEIEEICQSCGAFNKQEYIFHCSQVKNEGKCKAQSKLTEEQVSVVDLQPLLEAEQAKQERLRSQCENLQKALDEWWKDYNHLLGDPSGDSECRRKLQRIVKLFSAFKREGLGEASSETKKPRKLLDIADMPDFDCRIKDGIHSVSEGKIFWTDNNFVTCKEHGACNAVNKDLSIWRCLTCHEGTYVVWEETKKK